MRRLLLFAAFATFALVACGSDDTSTAAPPDQSIKCIEAGGQCIKNFPFLCPPGYEAAGGTLTSVCGREDPPAGSDIPSQAHPCCLPVTVGSVDSSTDAQDSADTRDAIDASDALDGSDADETDAKDAPADVSDASDAADGG